MKLRAGSWGWTLEVADRPNFKLLWLNTFSGVKMDLNAVCTYKMVYDVIQVNEKQEIGD